MQLYQFFDHPHSVMFHHFYGDQHAKGQGAISSQDFADLLEWLSSQFNLIGAREFQKKLLNQNLKSKDICLSFDDGLLCQYDIAAPILEARNIDAYFFVYTSPLLGDLNVLEIFRDFRSTQFADIEEFYASYFKQAKNHLSESYSDRHEEYLKLNYLKEFPFYTESDRWFRYLRDRVLGQQTYNDLMWSLLKESDYDLKGASSRLWMTEKQVKDLSDKGHSIGLHSYNHPTVMSNLPLPDQRKEYHANKEHLEGVIGKQIDCMSHPCGNYSPQTLDLLTEMGVQIGFRSSLSEVKIKSNLEIPRQDHILAFKEMRK